MRKSIAPLFATLTLTLTTACATEGRSSTRPVSYPTHLAPAAAAAPAPPFNPAAWFSPRDLARALAATMPSPPALVPVDVSRLAPAANTGPCSPFQVAPNVWIAPNCSSALAQPFASSPFVARRSFALGLQQASLPADVDLRRSGLDGPVKNQQMVGVCWAFALSTVMDNAIRRSGKQDVIAPLHVVSSHLLDEIWNKGHSDQEMTLESAWPYTPVKGCKLNESSSEVWCDQAYHVKHGSWRSDAGLVSEVDRANHAGAYRVVHVETLSVKPVNSDQIAKILASGQAVFATFGYNRQAWNSAGSVIPDYEQDDGRHAVVLVGYHTVDSGRQFLIHNSWGEDWRDHGYAWISEVTLRRHLTDALTFDVVAHPGLDKPKADPSKTNPTPAGTDGTCPSGQGRDALFGWCAPLCPNGAAPAGMLCAPTSSPNSGAPAPTSACPAGQARDLLTGACVAPCRSGLPPFGGMCA